MSVIVVPIPTSIPTSTVTATTTSKYVRNDAGEYVCPHCPKVTAKQNTMYYHIKKQHTQDLPFACTRCTAAPKFLQKSSYLHHLATVHSDDLKLKEKEKELLGDTVNPFATVSFTCPSAECDHSTHTKSNLKIHYARTHAKEWIPAYVRGEACGSCNRQFPSSSAYLYHSLDCFRSQATDAQLNVISRIR